MCLVGDAKVYVFIQKRKEINLIHSLLFGHIKKLQILKENF